ncbi:MAG: hydroxyacylglutathione hydrolase [Acinetobacter sp.]
MSDFKIHVIDVQNKLQNYIWLIEHVATRQVVVIDPTQADLVQKFCEDHQLTIVQIWLTHWHKDHVEGVPALQRDFPQTTIYGPEAESAKIPFMTHPLRHDDHFNFHNLDIEIISVPGHTLGHIIFYIDTIQSVFVGDTLFALGCGRVSEGTYAQMFHSVNRIAALPSPTKIYCAHEYTLSNAKFALHVEPDNLTLIERAKHIEDLRLLNKITLPTTVELELATNPFLRVETIQEFEHLRKLKDNF